MNNMNKICIVMLKYWLGVSLMIINSIRMFVQKSFNVEVQHEFIKIIHK